MIGNRDDAEFSLTRSRVPLEPGSLVSGSDSRLFATASSKPLSVIINASGRESVTPGSLFSLSVTVCNKGNQSAVIDVYLDDGVGTLRQWCGSTQEHLALGPDQTDEVVFPFQVPLDASPGSYAYLVVVDAQEHYPEDTPLRYPQQIQVLPATQDTIRASDPTFVLQPATASAAPAVLLPGGALPIQVLVHNRSDRVDRFRLVCTDLPRTWFTVTYPLGVQGSGLVVDAASLNLNPTDQGLITLLLHPPVDALAGTYVPTLRLYSENAPDLVLLDLVYLQVPPSYLLQAELRTVINRVKRQAGVYQVRLQNTGNTRRNVHLQVQNLDEDTVCTYRLERSEVAIAPKEIVGVELQVQPTKWWRRPFLGGGRVLNFNVNLEDKRQLPLTLDNLQGFLVWEARPWWQLLPLLLLGLLLLLTLLYLLWWLLFRVPPLPKIIQFASEDPVYAASNGDVVRLSWQISEPQRLESLRVTGLSPDGKPLTRPEVYDLSQGIPAALEAVCSQQRSLLTCRNVRTNARRPGTYVFELVALPKPGRGPTAAETMKTNPVQIAPIPQPKIVAFASTQPIYQELPATSPSPAAPNVLLNWAIANPDRLRSLQLVGRTPEGLIISPPLQIDFSRGVPAALQKFCEIKVQLVCTNLPTGIRKPGDYVFELTALPQTGTPEKPESLKTERIKILPKPSRILEFKLNGQTAAPKYLIPVPPGKAAPNVLLSWAVDASEGTKVELIPAPGSVPLKGSIPLVLSPKPGSVTVTLQVTSADGQQVIRAVTLDIYDPTTTDPAAAAAAAAVNAITQAQSAQKEADKQAADPAANGQSPSGAPELDAPTPATPETLSPVELPPQFDRR